MENVFETFTLQISMLQLLCFYVICLVMPDCALFCTYKIILSNLLGMSGIC